MTIRNLERKGFISSSSSWSQFIMKRSQQRGCRPELCGRNEAETIEKPLLTLLCLLSFLIQPRDVTTYSELGPHKSTTKQARAPQAGLQAHLAVEVFQLRLLANNSCLYQVGTKLSSIAAGSSVMGWPHTEFVFLNNEKVTLFQLLGRRFHQFVSE